MHARTVVKALPPVIPVDSRFHNPIYSLKSSAMRLDMEADKIGPNNPSISSFCHGHPERLRIRPRNVPEDRQPRVGHNHSWKERKVVVLHQHRPVVTPCVSFEQASANFRFTSDNASSRWREKADACT
jgi:hypothetical protein